jgi:hypothetical protein
MESTLPSHEPPHHVRGRHMRSFAVGALTGAALTVGACQTPLVYHLSSPLRRKAKPDEISLTATHSASGSPSSVSARAAVRAPALCVAVIFA